MDLRVLASPHYFGPVERRRFGMVHWPECPVRGSALIFPPVGYESVCTHQSLRVLAESMARRGIVAFRVDYDGCGNSIGDDSDEDRVASWLQSVVDAHEELLSFQCGTPVVVGLRLGATLAATRLGADPRVRGLAFWDPIGQGRRYARSLRLFAAASTESEHDQTVVGGIHFTNDTLAAIGALRLEVGALVSTGLLIERAESDRPSVQVPSTWQIESMQGTAEMVDVDAELAEVPGAIVERITEWTVAHCAGPATEPARPQLESTCIESRDEAVFVHDAVRFGKGSLFAVETRLRGVDPLTGVILLNNGVSQAIGPGRSWIELARRLASDGHLVVRLDLSGLGESPARPGRAEQIDYPVHAARDIAEAAERMQRAGIERIATVGLCSGALIGFEAALETPAICSVVSINGPFHRPFHDRRADRSVRAAGQTSAVAAFPLRKSPLYPHLQLLPRFGWRLLDWLHLAALPTQAFRRFLAHTDARAFLVFGDKEYATVALRHRSGPEFARLEQDPRIDVIEIRGLDHSMFDLKARSEVFDAVAPYLREVLRPSAPRFR